jgi:hypothetical protein
VTLSFTTIDHFGRHDAYRGAQGTLLDIGSRRWFSMLDRVAHDVYHLPGYVEASAVHEGGRPCALYVEDGGSAMLLPLILRTLSGGMLDATSPYGYPGPLVAGTKDPAFIARALDRGKATLASHGVVSLFVRLHPILNQHPPTGVGKVVRHGDTVSIDLSRSAGELWSQTRRDHRRDIRDAMDAGFVTSLDHTWRHFPTFKRLYSQTMARLSATPFYYFSDRYFETLKATLGSRLWLAVVTLGDAVAAAGLFTEVGGIVQAHLSGTDPAYNRHAPSKLMDYTVRLHAQERGNKWMHLGGGVGAEDDSLLAFKAGFSPIRHAFHTLRLITRPEDYHRLVRSRPGSLDPADLDGFFPLYRQS